MIYGVRIYIVDFLSFLTRKTTSVTSNFLSLYTFFFSKVGCSKKKEFAPKNDHIIYFENRIFFFRIETTDFERVALPESVFSLKV